MGIANPQSSSVFHTLIKKNKAFNSVNALTLIKRMYQSQQLYSQIIAAHSDISSRCAVTISQTFVKSAEPVRPDVLELMLFELPRRFLVLLGSHCLKSYLGFIFLRNACIAPASVYPQVKKQAICFTKAIPLRQDRLYDTNLQVPNRQVPRQCLYRLYVLYCNNSHWC